MPSIWAIADLHLSFGVPGKSMDVFGDDWANHAERIKTNWLEVIQSEDLVLIAGDISWGMRLAEAQPDLEWIHQLPGTKVMVRGNHDYWWNSLSQIAKICPPSIHLIQNSVFDWQDVSIGGARLWDTPDYNFGQYINYRPNPRAKAESTEKEDPKETQRIWDRELQRLEISLKALNKKAKKRIVMTHYPPISATLDPSQVEALLKKYDVDICVFGHLHNLKKGIPLFGKKDGVEYLLTSCDYLDFKPIKIDQTRQLQNS